MFDGGNGLLALPRVKINGLLRHRKICFAIKFSCRPQHDVHYNLRAIRRHSACLCWSASSLASIKT